MDGGPELGSFSMVVYLLETLFNLPNREAINKKIVSGLAAELRNEFPFFYEFVREDLLPADIKNSVKKNLQGFIRDFQDFENVVIVGIEALIIDILAREMPKTHFSIIPHDERIDNERIIANFPANVALIGVREVTKFRDSKSALVSYTFFHEMYGSAFVYPVVLRTIGPDVRCIYMDIVGLGILDAYTVYPHNMTEIASSRQFFNKKYALI